MTAMDMDMSTMDTTMNSTTDTASTTMMTMMAVFQNSMATPLYSMNWMPATAGAYAGTCIFLIVLGAAMRGLLAAKAVQEARWIDQEWNRRYVTVAGKLPVAERVSTDSMAKRMTLSENGVEENVMVVKKKTTSARPWRLSVDPVRAAIDTVIAGVGYLL
jgi:hypothetical protein